MNRPRRRGSVHPATQPHTEPMHTTFHAFVKASFVSTRHDWRVVSRDLRMGRGTSEAVRGQQALVRPTRNDVATTQLS